MTAPAATQTVTLTIARTGSFTGVVSLAVSGLPTGVTGSFNPTPIAAGQTTSTLTSLREGANPPIAADPCR